MSSVCLSVHLSVTIRYRPVARNFQVGVLSLTVLARGESVTQTADVGTVLRGALPFPFPTSWVGVLLH